MANIDDNIAGIFYCYPLCCVVIHQTDSRILQSHHYCPILWKNCGHFSIFTAVNIIHFDLHSLFVDERYGHGAHIANSVSRYRYSYLQYIRCQYLFMSFRMLSPCWLSISLIQNCYVLVVNTLRPIQSDRVGGCLTSK